MSNDKNIPPEEFTTYGDQIVAAAPFQGETLVFTKAGKVFQASRDHTGRITFAFIHRFDLGRY